MHVLFSAAVIACPLQTTYCHGYDSLILDTKTVHSKEDEELRQTTIMDKSLGILLNFWGVFQFTHTLPLPSPHKQRWTHVSRIFFPVSTLYRLGEGELQENFEKVALFHDSLCTNNLFSSQIFTEGRRVCTQAILRGSPGKVMNTIMNYWNYEYFPEDFCPGLYSRTSIIRISQLSGLFLWSQFGHEYLFRGHEQDP